MAVLGTKIHVPIPRHELVPRPRLTERLAAGPRATPRLVLVSAPPGFGKTTLLAQWLSQDAGAAVRAAWLSLDDADNDPRRFLTHLIAALQAHGMVAAEAAELVATAASVPIEAVLTSVVNDLDNLDHLDRRTVLTLDDYHVIESSEVHQAVAFLLDHLPPHVCLAIATRSDPPLPLPRLRARGELVEVRAADLRFTHEESGAFLGDVMGIDLSQAQVEALEARTEGWVAGVQLAGLSLRGADDPQEFVEAFTGSHRFVLDYLVEEVLRRQPDDVRRFLLDTAVLRQLTGGLCDALTGRNDGGATLEALDRANLFVVPLDDRRQWYRYHHLFSDALRARVAAEQPDRVPLLHRTASEWYAAHGLPEDAVRHALAGDDAERAADLVEAALPDLRRERQDRLVREWLTSLPDDVVRGRALLATYRAWTRLVEGDLDGVEAWLRDAERALATDPPSPSPGATSPPGARPSPGGRSGPAACPAPGASPAAMEELRTIPATIAIFRASAAQARGEAAATTAHARRALGLTGPDDHMARAGALGFLGLAAWGRGDLAEAVDTFSEAVRSMGSAGDVADELGSTVVLANMWMARGRPRQARRLLEQALRTARQHPGAALATLGDLHVALADVLVEQGELESAGEHLHTAQALGEPASLLENRYRWPAAMAGLRWAQGDLAAAVDLLDEAERIHVPGFFPEVRPVSALRARVWIAQGRLDDAWSWARLHRVPEVDDPTHLDEFDQLTLVRLLLAQHRADREAGRGEAGHREEGHGEVSHRGAGHREAGHREAGDREAGHGESRHGEAGQGEAGNGEAGHRAAGHREAGHLVEAARRLDRLVPGATSGRRDGSLVEIGLLRALTHQARGDLDAALAELSLVLEAGVPAGYVRLFLDEGDPMDELLRAAERLPAVGGHARVLSRAAYRKTLGEKAPEQVEGLSEREVEVLRLLATTLSGPEIARELYVSVNTLRTHTKHIFTKLDVNTRRAAVRRATELGVL